MTSITWTTSNSGNWNTATNWFPAQVPGISDDALIAQKGAYLITVGTADPNSITLDDPAAAISVTGTLTIHSGLVINSGTLAIGVLGVATTNGILNSGTISDLGSLTVAGNYTAAGLGQITGSGGILNLGTLMNSGGTFDATPYQSLTIADLGTIEGGSVVGITKFGTALLDAVTWEGTLQPDRVLTVRNGLVVTGTNGIGPGTITLKLNSLSTTIIDFQGNQTFDNASIIQPVSALNHTQIVADNDLTFGPSLSLVANPSGLPGFFDTIELTGAGIIHSSANVQIVGQIPGKFPAATEGFISVADFENSGTVATAGGPGTDGQIVITAPIFDNLLGGTLAAGGGQITSDVATDFTNNGLIVADTGAIVIRGALAGSGTLALRNASPIELGSSVSKSQSIDFQGAGNLTLDLPVFVASTINGFAANDLINLGVAATAIGYSTDDLKMQLGSGQTFDLAITGPHSFSDFIVNTASSSTTIQLACFAQGTRISTQHGAMAVEQLRVDDRVQVVLDGPDMPVTWIGHRHIDCTRHPKPRNVWPVRIVAGSFGRGRPSRDLFLSPDHAVHFNDVLIPVKYLMNRDTIVQVPVDEVTYYHVELPRHDILLAEGLPVETYLDVGDRSNFTNGDAPVALYPDFTMRMWEAKGCAPLVVTGPHLDAARAQLSAIAADMQRGRPRLRRSIG